MRRRPAREAGTAWVWALDAALAAGALGLWLGPGRRLPAVAAPVELRWWLLAAMFALVEVAVVHVHVGRGAHSYAFGEIPVVLGLFLARPGELLTAQLAGAGLALLLYTRQRPRKLAFNLAQYAMSTLVVLLVFHALAAGHEPLGAAAWAAALLATLAGDLLTVAATAAALALSGGGVRPRALAGVAALALAVTAANTSLGLLGARIVWTGPAGVWLLALPVAVLFFGYRAYTEAHQRHERLAFLYECSRLLQQPADAAGAVRALLERVRARFRTEIAEIVVLGDGDGPDLRTTLGPGQRAEAMAPGRLERDPIVARALAGDAGLLLRPGRDPGRDPAAHRWLAARGVKDALLVPLVAEDGPIGLLLVAGRVGDVASLDVADLQLAGTLAGQLAVWLENARIGVLEASVARLADVNALKNDFIEAVSLELRSPLTSILGYVRTLLRADVEFAPAERRSFLEAVERQSDGLRRLIDGLVLATRIESGQDQAERAVFSLPGLAAQVAGELGPRWPDHRLEVRFEEALPLLAGDAGKVRQILGELLENALWQAPPASTVRVGGACEGGAVVIAVADEGPAIPPGLRERLFDRFARRHGAPQGARDGTGLGLYLCRRLAESCGGEVWLQRSDEHGSEFRARIPCALADPAAAGAAS